MLGSRVVVMEEQQPQRESDVGSARVGTWPGSSTRGVALGALFAGLAAWKSGAPRAADVLSGAAVSDGVSSEDAKNSGEDAKNLGEVGEDSGDEVGTDPGGDAGARAASAPQGSMLDWLEVAATASDQALVEPAWRHGDDGLAAALGLVGRLRCALDRVEVAVAAEAQARGSANAHGLSTVDWLCQAAGASAPRPDVQHVTAVLRVAETCSGPAGEAFVDAFRAGAMPLAKADQVARFVRDVRPVADPDALAADVAALVGAASDDGRGRGLSSRELARAIRFAAQLIKPASDLENDEQRRRLGRALHKSTGPAGMSTYRVILDAEGAAVIDAALAALSAPVKGPDGELDPRPAATRRADALLEVVRRSVSSPGEQPRTEKAQVIVTIPLDHLVEQCRGAGLTMTGELLSPAVVRRMACDARIIPMVLGSRGEVLDIGYGDRFFTPVQRKAVWHRDHQCTFPGCTVPAQWAEVHHVQWWSRGGPSDLSNAALLCGRHHTLVHQRDLTATVTDTGVTWHV